MSGDNVVIQQQPQEDETIPYVNAGPDLLAQRNRSVTRTNDNPQGIKIEKKKKKESSATYLGKAVPSLCSHLYPHYLFFFFLFVCSSQPPPPNRLKHVAKHVLDRAAFFVSDRKFPSAYIPR